MSYSINNNCQNAYSGMIMGYFSAIEPAGWVFADGVARNNDNGKYTTLINLGIGTATGGYTPPNFKGAFLRGAGSLGDDAWLHIGPPLRTFYTPELKGHKHNATQLAHTHVLKAVFNSVQYSIPSTSDSFTRISTDSSKFGLFIKSGSSTLDSVDPSPGELINTGTSGITINENAVTTPLYTTSSVVNALSDNNESRPYNIGTNWIIKI